MGFPDKKVKFLGWKRRRFLQQGVDTVKLGMEHIIMRMLHSIYHAVK